MKKLEKLSWWEMLVVFALLFFAGLGAAFILSVVIGWFVTGQIYLGK